MREAVVRATCDRCKSVIEEKQGTQVDEPDDMKAFLIIRGTLPEKLLEANDALIGFDDLCGKCEARVLSLIEQIMKSGKGKGKRKRSASKTTKKRNTAKPPNTNATDSVPPA